MNSNTRTKDQLQRKIKELKKRIELLEKKQSNGDDKSVDFSELFERMNSSMIIFSAVNGGDDFIVEEYIASNFTPKMKEEKLIGSRITDAFPELVDAGLPDILEKVYKTGIPKHHIFPTHHNPDVVIWNNYHVIKSPSEKINVYYNDVTEVRNLLEAFHESEDKYKTLQENVPIGLYQSTPDGKFVYVNNWFAKILGYKSASEFMNLHVQDLYANPEQREVIIDRLNKEGNLDDTEVLLKCKNGSEIWAGFSAKTVYNCDNVVVSYDGYLYDITSRKIALESLQKSEENYKSLYSLFRLMADNVTDMIWAKDLDKNYIFTNKSICEQLLLAKNTNEPIGKSDLFFSKREREKQPENLSWYTLVDANAKSDDIVIRTKVPQRFEENGFVEGRLLYLDIYKAPLFDENGSMIGIVGSARDITGQKEIEFEKKREEKLKNVVYEISNAVNTTRDLNELYTVIRYELSKVVDTTNFFIALYDKEHDEITLPYFVDEKDRFRRYPAKNSLTHYLIRKNKPLLIKKNGLKELIDEGIISSKNSQAKVWIGVPLNVGDETTGAIVIQNYKNENAFNENDLELMKFVSNQISISISQKKTDDNLKNSESRLRQIIDTVPHIIFSKDKNLRFTLANRAMAKAYGLRVEEIEGKCQSEIHKNKTEAELFMQDDRFVLDRNKINIRKEEKFTDYNGNTRVLQTIKIPLKTEPEQKTSLLGVAIDITDRIESEIELKKAKDKAEESDKLKTAFLANMSHEIRTPMNAIIGFSELLNDPDLTTERKKEFIGLINDNSRILLNLIEDIIDVAKIEAEQIKIFPSICQVNKILDDLKEQYEGKLSNQNVSDVKIKVTKEIDEDHFAIITDPLRFKQILNNLIGNALKFTHKGSVEFGYSIQKNDKSIRFFVSDTGIGLSPEKTQVIFERFRQAEESNTKEYGGTGLGLTISRRLVELLGGTIWVESVLGHGSSFYFSLPYKLVKGEEKLKPFIKKIDKYDWSGKVIMVAEDEASNYELVKAALRKTKVKLIRANNGIEAVSVFKENESIDLVLMDIRMPEMNGYEATERIISFNDQVPVISLTAHAMAEDRQKSIQAGCVDYISKPFKPMQLIETISKYLTLKPD